jgi:Arylsulfotransferase (ASST)
MSRGRIALAAAVPCAAAVIACGGAGRKADAARTATPQTIATVAASTPSSRVDCRPRTRRFRTLPSFKPTGFCLVARGGAKLTNDLLLVTPRPDPQVDKNEQFGPMILSADGKLLWYEPRPDKVHDLKAIQVNGQPALAFWQRGHGGSYQLLDEHYRPIGRVRAGRGRGTDLHELVVTPSGAWVSSNVKRGSIVEYVVQRVDLATGRVLFEWRSLDHVKPSDSYERRPRGGKPWDYFHGNAIAPPTASDSTVVISSRNTSSLYGVDPMTGRTKWILGGKRDQFGLPRGWRFCAQHDAHRLANGDILLFDNGGTYMHGTPRCGLHAARSMRFRLDIAKRRARLVSTFSSRRISPRREGYFPGWVGSARLASDGDLLVDWGPNRRITEIGRDGRVDLLLKLQRWSYRAFPAQWVGRPHGAPRLAAQRQGSLVDVWMSWNGATQISRWRILAGGKPIATVPFADLETKATVRTPEVQVAVEALDAAGNVLGRSALTSEAS